MGGPVMYEVCLGGLSKLLFAIKREAQRMQSRCACTWISCILFLFLPVFALYLLFTCLYLYLLCTFLYLYLRCTCLYLYLPCTCLYLYLLCTCLYLYLLSTCLYLYLPCTCRVLVGVVFRDPCEEVVIFRLLAAAGSHGYTMKDESLPSTLSENRKLEN